MPAPAPGRVLRQYSLRSSRDLKRPVVLTRLEEGHEEPPWNAEAVRDGTDGDMLARLQQAIARARRSRQKQSPAERRWLRKRDLAPKLLRFLKCRSRWMARLDAGEDQISGREPPAFRDPAPEPAPPGVPSAERPYCPACRERDKVVLSSDPAPKHKRFAKPYCARCGDTLDRLPKHKLSPPDFD